MSWLGVIAEGAAPAMLGAIYGKLAAGPVQETLLDRDFGPLRKREETPDLTVTTTVRRMTSAERQRMKGELQQEVQVPLNVVGNVRTDVDPVEGVAKWNLTKSDSTLAVMAENKLDKIADGLARLGGRLGDAVATAVRAAETTVNVVSEFKVEDERKGGGSRRVRREERGVGPALGSRVAMSNFFILRDSGDVENVPDEFIFSAGPAPAVMQ